MYEKFFSVLWKQRWFLVIFWILDIIFYILGFFHINRTELIFMVIQDFLIVTIFFDEYENFKERLQIYWLAAMLFILPLAVAPEMGKYIVPKLMSGTLTGVILLYFIRLVSKRYK